MTPRARKQKQHTAAPAEWEDRGDGPVLGALLLAGLLDQVSDFRLNDFTAAIQDAAVYESQSGETLRTARLSELILSKVMAFSSLDP